MKWIAPATLVAAALVTPALAAPGDISVAAFLAKADALKKKGAMALVSADYALLKKEGTAAGEAYRARLQNERAAGRPSSCPPKGSRISSDQLLAHLRSYPVGVRASTTLKTALADYFIRTWPCA